MDNHLMHQYLWENVHRTCLDLVYDNKANGPPTTLHTFPHH